MHLLTEEISFNELDSILNYLNHFFEKYGVKVIFRSHFKDRLNDPRNENPITRQTFLNMVNKLIEPVNINKLRKMKSGQEGVLIYKSTNFVYTLELVGKQVQLRFITVMDKSKFRSNDSSDFILKLESFKEFYNALREKNTSTLS